MAIFDDPAAQVLAISVEALIGVVQVSDSLISQAAANKAVEWGAASAALGAAILRCTSHNLRPPQCHSQAQFQQST